MRNDLLVQTPTKQIRQHEHTVCTSNIFLCKVGFRSQQLLRIHIFCLFLLSLKRRQLLGRAKCVLNLFPHPCTVMAYIEAFHRGVPACDVAIDSKLVTSWGKRKTKNGFIMLICVAPTYASRGVVRTGTIEGTACSGVDSFKCRALSAISPSRVVQFCALSLRRLRDPETSIPLASIPVLTVTNFFSALGAALRPTDGLVPCFLPPQALRVERHR